MLRVFGGGAGDCDGITRRSFVQAGVLGLGGWPCPTCSGSRSGRASGSPPGHRIRLSGGPGHMETWDPKPDPRRVPRPVRAIHERARGPVRRAPARAGAADGPAGHPARRSTTARATTPRATTGCSPATRARPSTPPTSASSAGRRWARRWPGSEARTRRAAAVRRRARTCAAGPTTSSTTRPTSAARPTRSSSSPTRTTRSSRSAT